MTSQQKLLLLRAKLKSMEPCLDQSLIGLIGHFSLILDRVEADAKTIPTSAYNDIDREFEQIMLGNIAPGQVALIRRQLVDQCGQDSLRNPPDKMIKAILKRHRITSELEAKTVEGYLSGDYQGIALSSREIATLSELISAHESSA